MSDTTKTPEEQAKDLAEQKPPVQGTTKDFLSKVAFKEGDPPIEKTPEERESEHQQRQDERQSQKTEVTGESITKKKPFIKEQIEAKQEAEKKVGELQSSIEKYEKETVPQLNQKIADLEKKIAESGSSDTTALQARLDALNVEKQTIDENYTKEIKELRSKLAFRDLTEDPDFQKEYVQPMRTIFTNVTTMLKAEDNGDVLEGEFRKAMNANTSALNASSEEEWRKNIKMRDELLSQIVDTMPTFSRGKFVEDVNNLIAKSQGQAQALRDHEQTYSRILEERRRNHEMAVAQTKKTWKSAYDESSKSVESMIEIPEEIADVIKSEKIQIEDSTDDEIAQASIDGSKQFSPHEVTRLVHQGRMFKRLLGINSAKDIIISRLKSEIEGLKKTSDTTGGSRSQSDPPNKDFSQKKSEFIGSFRPR